MLLTFFNLELKRRNVFAGFTAPHQSIYENSNFHFSAGGAFCPKSHKIPGPGKILICKHLSGLCKIVNS